MYFVFEQFTLFSVHLHFIKFCCSGPNVNKCMGIHMQWSFPALSTSTPYPKMLYLFVQTIEFSALYYTHPSVLLRRSYLTSMAWRLICQSLTFNEHVHGLFNALFAPIYAGSKVTSMNLYYLIKMSFIMYFTDTGFSPTSVLCGCNTLIVTYLLCIFEGWIHAKIQCERNLAEMAWIIPYRWD